MEGHNEPMSPAAAEHKQTGAVTTAGAIDAAAEHEEAKAAAAAVATDAAAYRETAEKVRQTREGRQFPKPLPVPQDAVVLQKVRGPNGVHPRVGQAIIGRLYTVPPAIAAEMTAGESAEFVPWTDGDADKIRKHLANRGAQQRPGI